MRLEIRAATEADAAAACEVLRRSIAALCRADHRDNPAALAAWLANKTPAAVAGWIAAPGHCVLLAVSGGSILGVGSVDLSGRIGLNYVAPDARFQGVSKALLRALEDAARARGALRCTLESTATARRFYRACGYADIGPPAGASGMPGYPMAKALGSGQ
jgi:GNAT superfamily N-acetyltransferase